MLGQRILPLDGLQAGYRHISLRTEGNFPMSLPMLFICIELKIYVPDGLGDLIDALSDPRAFLSNQEKRRLQQMKAMGVEDTDLTATILAGANSATAAGGLTMTGNQQAIMLDTAGLYVSGGVGEFEQSKFCEITIAALKQDKKFLKLRKKQENKLQELIKEQQEEKQKTLKKQCQQLEKYLKQNNYSLAPQTKQMLVKRKLTEQPNSCSSSQTLNNFFSRPPSSQDESQASEPAAANNSAPISSNAGTLSLESIAKDEQIEKIINEQIKDWSVLLDKQKKIEYNLCRHQVEHQNEKLRKLMLREQAKQIKKIDFLFAKQIKEMKNRQAKISVDTYKEVIGDKTLRNKMERDRRLREKKCNNTKKFIEERRTAAIIHSKENERLKKMHTAQVSYNLPRRLLKSDFLLSLHSNRFISSLQLIELERYSKHAIESFNGAEVEYKLFSKKKCFC